MNVPAGFYRFFRGIAAFLLKLMYPVKITGQERVPEGAAIVCANHSHFIDPAIVAVACGKAHQLYFMAKAELFQRSAAGWLLRKFGAFPVQRGETDLGAVRTVMRLLKGGYKVLIFPEGTRVQEADAVAAKTGAVRFASKLNVPIVPVYVPRHKRLFRAMHVSIGEPYYIDEAAAAAYQAASAELMRRIEALV